MAITYNQHTALEEALERVNDELGFCRIEMTTEWRSAEDQTPRLVDFKIGWKCLGTVDPYLAGDCAEALTWAADMAKALDRLNLRVDWTDTQETEEYFDLVHDLARAIMNADDTQITDALDR